MKLLQGLRCAPPSLPPSFHFLAAPSLRAPRRRRSRAARVQGDPEQAIQPETAAFELAPHRTPSPFHSLPFVARSRAQQADARRRFSQNTSLRFIM